MHATQLRLLTDIKVEACTATAVSVALQRLVVDGSFANCSPSLHFLMLTQSFRGVLSCYEPSLFCPYGCIHTTAYSLL